MKGVITVGSGGGSGATTTAASGAGSNVALVTTPKAAVPRSAGKPAIYWAGWGLFAVGALLALMLIALYVRFTPGFNRQKRLAFACRVKGEVGQDEVGRRCRPVVGEAGSRVPGWPHGAAG